MNTNKDAPDGKWSCPACKEKEKEIELLEAALDMLHSAFDIFKADKDEKDGSSN